MRQRMEISSIKANEILSHWRQERAFRVGHILGLAGLVLSSFTTFFDLYYHSLPIILADLVLVIGCALTWYWSRASQRKSYFWYPLYFGYWFASIPTYWTTGGISGPFFGIGIALLYVLGEILDVNRRSRLHFAFAALHLPAFVIIEQFIPLRMDSSLPSTFIAAITGANLAGLYVGFRAIMKTEEELSLDFAERHAEIQESQAIAKVGSWSWNISKDLITWSDEIFKMFELKKEEFDPSYSAYLARLTVEHRDHINGLILKSAETGEDFIFEHVIDSSTGKKHIFARGRVVKDLSGNTISMVGTSQDVTERKKIEAELLAAREELEQRVVERTVQLEQSLEREKASRAEAERASQAKMQFLANMSHEIRTPMNSILGFSEILATENYTPEKTREFVERIRTNGDQLLRLIDDILDLSKFEAGKIPIQKTPVDIRTHVTNIVKSFEPAVSSKNLSLEVSIDGGIADRVLLDSNRTAQVITNLLSNAIKFSDAGVIRVAVSTVARKIAIRVEDMGMGISSENQKNLFQLFSQGDSSIARKFGGSGLGLALSKRIAEAMGGTLELQWSASGKGSIFVFEAPFEPVQGPRFPRGINASLTVGTSTPPAERRILLVEDSPDNAFLICHFIKPLGYLVDVASDGLQAVEAAARKPYDCILMDIQMPGMDGLEATRRIRAAGFVKPIIALTAHALPTEVEKSLAAGCNDHLTKPISRGALAEAIRAQMAQA